MVGIGNDRRSYTTPGQVSIWMGDLFILINKKNIIFHPELLTSQLVPFDGGVFVR